MFERTRPIRPSDKVEIRLEGRSIVAKRGEPIAVALLASGEVSFARSPKLHRPRSPSCLRGDCDGCLARVDGVPNVMTCLRDVVGGEAITVQNVLGSRKLDLLRVTDWFFPKGIDHHHLMAGVPGVSDVMQTFARQMAGVGRLPDHRQAPVEAARLEVDAIVVGGGLAGLGAAAELARRGLSVCLVEERSALGGTARSAGKSLARAVDRSVAELEGVHVLTKQTAVGVFDREVLVASDERATLVRPRVIVIATGAHDGQILTDGNDLPGVVSERAALVLAGHGVLPKGRAVVVGETPLTGALVEALGERAVAKLAVDDVAAIEGRSQVTAVKPKKGKKIPADVVVVAAAPAPSFELGAQAGATVERTLHGYALVVDENGHARDNVFAIGECTGAELDAASIAATARRLAEAVSVRLGQPSSIESKSPKPPATKTTSKRPSSKK